MVDFDGKRLKESAILYRNVFTRSPWNQSISLIQIEEYFKKLLGMNTFLGYMMLEEDNSLIGVSLGYLKPWIDGYEYYIDQLYIDGDLQNKGYGRIFLKTINENIRPMDVSSILLTTESDVDAYNFYLKSGFQELNGLRTLVREV